METQSNNDKKEMIKKNSLDNKLKKLGKDKILMLLLTRDVEYHPLMLREFCMELIKLFLFSLQNLPNNGLTFKFRPRQRNPHHRQFNLKGANQRVITL